MKDFIPLRRNKRPWAALAFGLLALAPLSGNAKTPWPRDLERNFAQITPVASGSPEVLKALCPDPSQGKEIWEKDAGKDDAGRTLKVVRVARLYRDAADQGCASCALRGETWSLALSPQAPAEKRLLEKDPFADRQEMDPDSPGNLPGFQIAPNQLTITTISSRGSWGGVTTWQLSPFKILKQSWEHRIPAGGADTSPPFFQASWDWAAFTGSGAMEVQRPCPSRPKAQAGQFLFIPMLPYGDDFIQKSWKKTGLGDHALKVTGDNAFVLAGRPEQGLVMKIALASPKDLFVEIPKTKFTAASNWLYSDHLELWQVEGPAGYESEFSDVQWGIQLGNGRVYAAHGDPKGRPQVEKAVLTAAGKPPATILHIRLSTPVEDFGFLTLSYSASQKGRKVGSLLATSNLCFGQGETLGLVKKIDAAAAGY